MNLLQQRYIHLCLIEKITPNTMFYCPIGYSLVCIYQQLHFSIPDCPYIQILLCTVPNIRFRLLCYHNKYHQTGGLNNQHLFLIILEARSLGSGCQFGSVLDEGLLLGDVLTLPHIGDKEVKRREGHTYLPFLLVFYKDINPIMGAPSFMTSSKLKCFSNVPPPHTITLRFRVSIYKLGQDTNIQSIATSYWLPH